MRRIDARPELTDESRRGFQAAEAHCQGIHVHEPAMACRFRCDVDDHRSPPLKHPRRPAGHHGVIATFMTPSRW
jgi:hypothetical protein